MRFRETPLPGAILVEVEPIADQRGFFARTWCSREFGAHGLSGVMVQASISWNERKGTVRGMHLQLPPSREAKLVRCTRGAIHDVIVDMRPDSACYLGHFGVELSVQNRMALYIPPQMAHGFQTLEDGTEVLYQMSDFHVAELACGWRWNDPAFGIRWPIDESITMLPRDAQYPDFDDREFRCRLQRAARAGDEQSALHGSGS